MRIYSPPASRDIWSNNKEPVHLRLGWEGCMMMRYQVGVLGQALRDDPVLQTRARVERGWLAMKKWTLNFQVHKQPVTLKTSLGNPKTFFVKTDGIAGIATCRFAAATPSTKQQTLVCKLGFRYLPIFVW